MINKALLLFVLLAPAGLAVAQKIQHYPFGYHNNDSVITIASDRYKAHSLLRYLFMGKNYRRVWNQPVTVPVFRLSQMRFKIEELGGGRQTKSLRLLDTA